MIVITVWIIRRLASDMINDAGMVGVDAWHNILNTKGSSLFYYYYYYCYYYYYYYYYYYKSIIIIIITNQ